MKCGFETGMKNQNVMKYSSSIVERVRIGRLLCGGGVVCLFCVAFLFTVSFLSSSTFVWIGSDWIGSGSSVAVRHCRCVCLLPPLLRLVPPLICFAHFRTYKETVELNGQTYNKSEQPHSTDRQTEPAFLNLALETFELHLG
jgi:hypothetical protein